MLRFQNLLRNNTKLVVALGVVLVGVSTLAVVSAQAARPSFKFEAEAASTSSGISTVNNTNASGGAYVQFNGSTPILRRFPGDPNPRVTGKSYWGADIEGNGDPYARHEAFTNGKSVSIRRAFFSWSQATTPGSWMYDIVEDDHAHNRLPFVSFKPAAAVAGGSGSAWQDIAEGRHDAAIDAVLQRLDSYNKPVWLAFHHEPEGGGGINSADDPGGPTAWRGAQKRIRQRMTAVGTRNIAFMPVLMTWTWDTRSGRNQEDWWLTQARDGMDGADVWDAYCVDHYNDKADESGDMFTIFQNAMSRVSAATTARGLPMCIAEWGNRGTDTQTANEMQAYWDWAFSGVDVIGYSYYDSGTNAANGSWVLTGEPLTKFRSILQNDTRVQRINDL